jgi:integrase
MARPSKPWVCESKATSSSVLASDKWTTHSITWKYARVCRKAGVKTTAYCLRHTFATDARANGVPDAQVAVLLGHSGTAMLHKHYAHLTARSQVLRDALGKVR